MDNVAEFALAMLYKAQKALKIAIDVNEAMNKYPEETARLKMKLLAVEWLIALAIKEA